MFDVEQAIREVGAVYQALTGRAIEAGRSELPPEVDPWVHLEGRYRQFKAILESPGKGAVPAAAPVWAPAMDVVEREQEVRCELDLPAIPRDQLAVSVVGDYLVVRGRRPGAVPNGGAMRRAERPVGPFQRAIALPPTARRESITAVLRDGVLAITIPTDGAGADKHATPIEVR